MKPYMKIFLESRGIHPCDVADITCEYCGAPCDSPPHHIWRRGMGGNTERDVPENLIALCMKHHIMADANNIPKEELLEIVKKILEK